MKQKLVYLLKHNPFIQRVYKHTMSFIFRLIGLFVPVDPDLVLFVSFMGTKYNDSPRAISEYLARNERYAHLRRVWALEHPENYPTEKELEQHGYSALWHEASTIQEAEEILEQTENLDLALLDIDMGSGRETGIGIAAEIRERFPA